MNETQEVWEEAISQPKTPTLAGFPLKYAKWNVQVGQEQINVFIPGEGCFCIYSDGTWTGDIAPFCG